MPGRFVTGVQIQINIFKFEKDFRDAVWGVATAVAGEFLLPDTFGRLAAVPLSPRLLLVGNSEDAELSDVGVRKVNRLALESARDYYIARDFAAEGGPLSSTGPISFTRRLHYLCVTVGRHLKLPNQ